MEPKHSPHGRMGRRRGHSRSQLMLRHRQQGQVSIGFLQVSKWGLSSSSWFLLKNSCLLPWTENKLRNIMKRPVGHENPEYVLESTLHTWPTYTLLQTYFRDFNYTKKIYVCTSHPAKPQLNTKALDSKPQTLHIPHTPLCP